VFQSGVGAARFW